MSQWIQSLKIGWAQFWAPRTNRQVAWGVSVGIATLLVVGLLYRISQEIEPGPCTPGGFPFRCYHIHEKMCDTVWAQAERSCQAKIKGLALPPTRLSGPIQEKCQLAAVDSAFSLQRTTSPECDDLHKDLEAWLQRNPDFR